MSKPYDDPVLRRRLAAPVLQAPEEGGVVDNSSTLGRMANRSADNFESQFSAYAGLANQAMGDTAAAQEDFAQFDRLQRRAREAFELQSLDDVEAAGGDVGDYAKFALGEAVNFAPDIVGTLLPAVATGGLAGIAAGVARGAGTATAKKAAKEITEDAVRNAARGELNDVAQSAALRVASERLKDSAGDAASMEAATLAGRQAGLDAVRGELVGRRVADDIAGAMRTGQTIGQALGATAAQSVGLSRDSVDVVRDKDAAAAQSVLATDLFAAAIGSVPAMRMLGRYGMEPAKLPAATLRTFVPRVAKEFAAQGASESITEVTQTAAQLWGHKQVMDSIDLMGPKAFDQYVSAMLGGFIAGGAMGGAAEGFRGTGSGLAKLVGFTRESAKQSLKDLDTRLRRVRGQTPADPNAPTPSPAAAPAAAAVSPVDAPVPSPSAAAPTVSPAASPAAAPTPDADTVSTFRGIRASLGENDPTPSPGFSDAPEDADYDTELDRLLANVSSEMRTLFEGLQQSPLQLPVQFDSKIQSLVMANLDPDWSGFDDPYTARGAAAALEKLFIPDAEMTPQDDAYLDLLTSGANPALPMDTLKKWQVAGKPLGRATEIASRTTAAEEDAVEMTGADEIGGLISDARADLTGVETSAEAGAIALERAGLRMRTAEPSETKITEESVAALRRQNDTPEDPALGRIERLKEMEAQYAQMRARDSGSIELMRAKEELDLARSMARADLLGMPTGDQPFGKNVIYTLENTNSKGKAKYETDSAQPHFLEIQDPTAPKGARLSINLRDLIAQQRVRTPNVSEREALLNGLSNLRDLGVNFDIDKLRPFSYGGVTLNKAEVAAIKAPPTKRRVDTPARTKEQTVKDRAAWVQARANEIARAAGRGKPTPADRNQAIKEMDDRAVRNFSDAMTTMARESRDTDGVPGADSDADRFRQGPRAQAGGFFETNTPDGRPMVVSEDAPVSVTPSGRAMPNAAINEDVDTGSAESRAARQQTKDRLVKGLEAFIRSLEGTKVDAQDWDKMPKPGAMTKLRLGQDLSDFDVADLVEFVASKLKSPKARQALALRVNQYFDGMQSPAAERAVDAATIEAESDRAKLAPLGKAAGDAPSPSRKVSPEDRATRVAGAKAKQDAIAADPTKRPAPQVRKVAAAPKPAAPKPAAPKSAAPKSAAPKAAAPKAAAPKADLTAEQAMLDKLTEAMGIPSVRITEMKPTGRRDEDDGRYTVDRKGRPVIYIHPRIKGRERFSVIAHELGHHVIITELMRGVEGDVSYRDMLKVASGTDAASTARFQAALRAANPELFAAMKADYDAWLERISPDMTYRQVRSMRATRSRAKGQEVAKRGVHSKEVADLSDAKREYLLDFHEYIADGIARALEGNSTAQGIVSQFFKRIADNLRRLYNAIVKNNPEWRSPPSIEAYVNGLFNERRNTVAEVLGQPVSNSQANTAVEAAAAIVIATAPQTVGVDTTPPSGGEPPAGGEPPSGGDGAAPSGPPLGDINALAKYVARVMPPETRLLIERVINRGGTTFKKMFSTEGALSTVGTPAMNALRERFKGNPEAVRLMDTEARGMEYRIAGLLVLYSEQGNAGSPQLTDLIRNVSDQLWELAGRVGDDALVTQALDDMLTGKIEDAKNAGTLYSPGDRAMAKNKARNRTLLKLTQYYDNATEVLSRYWVGRQDRINSFGIPALRKVGAMIHRRAGATDRMDGLLEDKVQKSYALIEKYREATDGLSDEQKAKLLNSLQSQANTDTGDTAVDKARQGVRALFTTLHKYLDESGVRAPNGDRLGFRENFFPVRMLLDDDIKIAKFRQLMSDEKFYERMREALGKPKDTTQAALIKDMEEYLTAPPDWQAIAQNTGGTPNFKSLRPRLAQFVYDLGTPEQIQLFKELQNPDLDAVMGEYILSSVNRAEFAKRFGDDGAKLDKLYVQAQAEGATPEQLAYVRDVVRSAVGLYALDGSPLLSKLSPQVGQLFAKQNVKEASELMMAYQNWRNLPLAVLSSATEIFGPSIRSGGDLKVAWTGLKTTVKTLFSNSTRQELQELLKNMGYSQDFAIGENQQSMFGGTENSQLARRMNDVLFKWNGLTRWTTSTRFGSLAAAQQFLVKHAAGKDGKDKNSARYLEELNLREGDVILVGGQSGPKLYLMNEAELSTADEAERARDARVKRALIRFVDEAVPRPNVAQTPLYYSDPAMQFIVQYKAVLHAVYQQYYKRIAKEMAYGNFAPLMPALFMAATAAVAELLRENIQTAGEGDPRRADWDAIDYAMLGAQRTALFPPSMTLQTDLLNDFTMRHAEDIFLGSSQLGPTIKQAMQLQSAAAGDRPAAQVVENALPASALWKQWINPTEWN